MYPPYVPRPQHAGHVADPHPATTTHACTPHRPTHRSPQDFQPPSGEVKTMIEAQWKSLDNFISTFNAQTAAVQVRVRGA